MLDGGDGDDTLDGGPSEQSYLKGGPGADTLSNGIAAYEDDNTGVVVNLSASSQLVNDLTIPPRSAMDGSGSIDVLGPGLSSGIGSFHDDVWIGPDSEDFHYVIARSGNDVIRMGPGTDQIFPGPGEDYIDGGPGVDSLAYPSDAPDGSGLVTQGITVSLAEGRAIDGWGFEDTFINIEDVSGSELDDIIVGDDGDNSLSGGDGEDTLEGGSGNDTLDGGRGNDQLEGGAGLDRAKYSGDVTDYLIAESSDIVTVTDLNLADGDDGTDTLTDIEFLLFSNYTWDFLFNNIIGTRENDKLSGTPDDDILTGFEGDDTLEGFGGDDFLFAGSNDDTLDGGDGKDELYGGGGDDTLYGGNDPDTLRPGAGHDVVDGGEGVDLVEYDSFKFANALAGVVINLSDVEVEIDGVFVSPRTAIDPDGGVDTLISIESVVGTNGNDTIITDTDTVSVAGRAGDDTIIGSVNHEGFNGSPGNDFIDGGEGEDWITFGDDLFPFADSIVGVLVNLSDDAVEVNGSVLPPGTAIDPYGDVDTLLGIKYIQGTDNDDAIFAGASTQFVDGFDGDDTIVGLDGNDLLFGGKGNDTLIGGSGDDLLFGGPGDDSIDGGEGFDVFALAGDSLDDYLIVEGDGVTTVTDLNLADGDEVTDAFVNVEEIGFIVLGTEDADRLFSEKDKPVVVARLAGDDTYVLVNQDDVVFEKINEGSDTVEAGITRRLEGNVENLTLTGDANVDGFGNQLNNEINGNIGNNVIDGGAGADVMEGGSGADTYYVDDVGDQVIETDNAVLLSVVGNARGRARRRADDDDLQGQDVGDDIDEVISTVSFSLTDFVENLTLDGTEEIDGTGNELDNSVVGNAGDNILSGLDGSDLMTGGDGDDILIGGSGDDELDGEAGNDIAAFTGNFTDYEIILSDGVVTVNDRRDSGSSDGVDRLQNIEVLRFSDADYEVVQIIDPNNDGLLWDSSFRLIDASEVSATEAQLYRAYRGALDRLPDREGYDWWLTEIQEGRHTLTTMLAGFIWSEEFLGIFSAPDGNSIGNEEFLDHIYMNVFGREPDPEGEAFWIGELASGNRNQTRVLEEMTQSNEFVELTLNSVVDYLIG